MSSSHYYKCNNCNFSVRESGGQPFYNDPNTNEKVFPMEPIPLELHEKIEGKKYTKYCLNCLEGVNIYIYDKNELTKQKTCPKCHSSDKFIEDESPCPKCREGKLFLQTPKVSF